MTTTPSPALDDLLTTAELAARWSVTVGHLKNLRYQRRGVPFLKIGGLVAYRKTDVIAYEDARVVATLDARPLHSTPDPAVSISHGA